MVELDQETRDKIIETHTDVKHMMSELDHGREEFKRVDKEIRATNKRLRRVENWFLPLVAFLGLVSHRILKWLGL